MKIWNRDTLKFIAIVAMLLDHIAASFLPAGSLLYGFMRLSGRLTAAIMCFFIAEGFYHTRSKWKYGMRLGLFALISQFACIVYAYGTVFTYELLLDWSHNVIITLFLGFCMLAVYEKVAGRLLKWMMIVTLCAVSYLGDWMMIAPLWILCFHIYRDERKKNLIAFGSLAALEVASCLPSIMNRGQIWHVGVFLVIPLLLLYNGKKGSGSPFVKWAFYLFYPLHMLALGAIKMFLPDFF